MKKTSIALISAGFAAGVIAGFFFRFQADKKPSAPNETLASLNEQVSHLRVENEQLSRLVEQPGQQTPRPPDRDAASGWIRFGKEMEFSGLSSANQHHDGVTEPASMGGLDCHQLVRYPGRPELYAYFRIEPAFKDSGTNAVTVEVEYFDADEGGHFRLDYDSYNESNRSLGAYTQSKEKAYLKGTQRWRKARFLLDDGRFEGRENDQSDFRVTVVAGQFFLRSVKMIRE